MFDKLLEKIQRVDEIESKLLSIFEGKTWEQIALALYQILDDIDTASDIAKDDLKLFQSMVMRHQAKKNQYLYSPDGYNVVRVDEWKEPSQEQLDKISQEMFGKDYDELPVIMQITVKDKATVKYKVDEQLYMRPHSGGEKFRANHPKDIERYRELVGEYGDFDPETHIMVARWNPAVKEFDKPHPLSKETFSTWELEESNGEIKENLTDHARRELELAGMFDKEVDGSEAAGSWNRLCAEAVMELMEVFAKQGHSGFSASMTQDLFNRLAKYEKLTELTDNLDEWMDVHEYCSDGPDMWQSQRSPSCFSEDGGKTYWDIDEDWNKREDEDGSVWSGGLSKEEWDNRPMHQSKHIEEKE